MSILNQYIIIADSDLLNEEIEVIFRKLMEMYLKYLDKSLEFKVRRLILVEMYQILKETFHISEEMSPIFGEMFLTLVDGFIEKVQDQTVK